MKYTVRTVTPPTFTPITLEAAKAHLRVRSTDEDSLITSYIASTVDHIERFTNRVLANQLMEATWCGFPAFPEALFVPRNPVTEIVSLKYTDTDGEEVTISDFRWNEASSEVVYPAFRSAWPSAMDELGSVRLRFRAGYDEGLAPGAVLLAVEQLLEHLYYNRGAAGVDLQSVLAEVCAPLRPRLL